MFFHFHCLFPSPSSLLPHGHTLPHALPPFLSLQLHALLRVLLSSSPCCSLFSSLLPPLLQIHILFPLISLSLVLQIHILLPFISLSLMLQIHITFPLNTFPCSSLSSLLPPPAPNSHYLPSSPLFPSPLCSKPRLSFLFHSPSSSKPRLPSS